MAPSDADELPMGQTQTDGGTPAPPVFLAYPMANEDMRVGDNSYWYPLVKFLDAGAVRELTRDAEASLKNYEDFVMMAEQVSSGFGGPKKLDNDFLKGIWNSAEGSCVDSARADWAINHLIAIWEATDGTGFVSGEAQDALTAAAQEMGAVWTETPAQSSSKTANYVGLMKGNAGKGVVFSIEPDLPKGLALASKTGVISGSPEETTEKTAYTVTCSAPGGDISTSIEFACAAQSAPVLYTYHNVERAYFIGQPMALVPRVKGTVSKWSIRPALPQGLKFDAESGHICGVPRELAAETTWTVVAKNDHGGVSTKFTFEVCVCPPCNLKYQADGEHHDRGGLCGKKATWDFCVNMSVCLRPTYEGEAKSFKIKPDLPEGLTLAPGTGEITGTVTTERPIANYTVVAENDGGTTKATVSFSVKNLPTKSVKYPSIDDIYGIGESMYLEPVVCGGASTWAVEPGLPNGVTLNAQTGTITGAPTAAVDEVNYTVTASNEVGGTSTLLTFSVFATPPEELSYENIQSEYPVGKEIDEEPYLISGGCAVTFFSTPVLPTGLCLDPNTGRIHGVPEKATTSTTYTISASNPYGQATADVDFAVTSALSRCQSLPQPQKKETEEEDSSSSFARELENITDLSALPPEPSKEHDTYAWMLWLVHRAWLDDPSLTTLDFSGRVLPQAQDEYRLAPKLMKAMAVNKNIKTLNLADTRLRSPEGVQLAASLQHNTTLQSLNVDNNLLDSEVILAIITALLNNKQSALTTLICSSQAGLEDNFGKGVETKLVEVLDANHTLTKVTIPCQDAHLRSKVESLLKFNGDEKRRSEKSQGKAAQGKAARTTAEVQTKVMTKVQLTSAPSKPASECFAFTPKHELVSTFMVEKQRLPTREQLQLYARNKNQALKYAEVAPVTREFKQALLAACQGCTVAVVDATNKNFEGKVLEWIEKNDRMSLSVDSFAGERYLFTASKEPTVEVMESLREWLAPVAQGGD